MTTILRTPVEQLVDQGVLVHVGWQAVLHTPDMLSPNVHKHYFDSWDDEQIAFHVQCHPVFAQVKP